MIADKGGLHTFQDDFVRDLGPEFVKQKLLALFGNSLMLLETVMSRRFVLQPVLIGQAIALLAQAILDQHNGSLFGCLLILLGDKLIRAADLDAAADCNLGAALHRQLGCSLHSASSVAVGLTSNATRYVLAK
jgi:hypothetical protein